MKFSAAWLVYHNHRLRYKSVTRAGVMMDFFF